MNKIKIAIIDSGVKVNHPAFRNNNIEGFCFENEHEYSDFEDEYGHGTAIYNIISSCEPFADITNIKIKGISAGITQETLQSILNHICKNYNFDIINMSLGTDFPENSNALYDVVNNLTSKGTIIVSAFDNSGTISYPAAFPNVIGVTTSFLCKKNNNFEYIDDDILNIAGKGMLQKVAWKDPDYMIISGNSFACAHVTVQVANFMRDGIRNRQEILSKFSDISLRNHKLEPRQVETKLFEIKKAALFPFNKEMHSLIRFPELLKFQITNVYDIKYSAIIGAYTTHILKDDKAQKLLVKNIDDINWNSFDTLIIGHLDKLSQLVNNKTLRTTLIDMAIKKNKNVFCFDDINYKTIPSSKMHKIYVPKVVPENLPANRVGMLYRIYKPVVGVFGTSSKQGKFTLQLLLRKIFLSKGYKVGQIGSEPSSLLYGMNYVYPMGYNSSIYIKEHDTIRYLNYIINELCAQDYDLIMIGSQSSTLQYDTGNISLYPIAQLNFLIATQPDIIVLCVNPFDDIDFISRTISFVENFVNCKVVAIVVYPMDLQNNWHNIYGSKVPLSPEKYTTIKKDLIHHFNIPVFKLGDEKEMYELADIIIDFFAE